MIELVVGHDEINHLWNTCDRRLLSEHDEAPGGGTRVVVTFPMPRDEGEGVADG